MMDRNLGALVIADYDPRTYGLLYQWGRKDPFVNFMDNGTMAKTNPHGIHASGDYYSYDYSISNPTISLVGKDWNQGEFWSPHKTIYDPCPSGWKVSDKSAWEGIPIGGFGTYPGGAGLTKVMAPYSEPEACFYSGGWVGAYFDLNNFNDISYCHTTSGPSYDHQYVYSISINDQLISDRYLYRDYLIPVRCMKEIPMTGGGNEGFTEDDEIEW
jgi:hypothetical protein